MGRLLVLILYLMFLMVASCHRSETVVPAPVSVVKDSLDKIRVFDHPVLVFVYPDSKQTEKLKEKIGDDKFYSLTDQKGVEYSEIRRFAAKHHIETWSGTSGIFRFITEDGTIIDINTGTSDQPWKQIIFNGKDAPSIVNTSNAGRLIAAAFKTDTKQKREKKVTISALLTNNIPPDDKLEELPSPVDFLPGLKETTIRLMIFPGEKPPPLRDQSNGIRTVNSFISPGHRFWFQFDNDIFSNTDRYYTNGIVIGYSSPGLTSWRLNRLMVKHNRNSVVNSSVSLHHGMFTPLTTKTPPPLANDRPYASTLYLRYSQVSEDAGAGVSLSSSIEAGVIGNAALGQLLQRTVHAGIPSNDEPVGWDTQIKNDIVLNYNVDYQKRLHKSNFADVYTNAKASLGTLYTRAGLGINGIIGVYSPVLTPLPENYDQLKKNHEKWQYGISGGFELRMIGYDASLQGGLFNRDNIFALKPDELERLVAALNLGLFLHYKNAGISITQFYLSPEFKAGKQHFWGQIGLQIAW